MPDDTPASPTSWADRIGARRLLSRRPLMAAAALASASVLAVSGLSYAAVYSFTENVRHENVFGGLANRPDDDQGINVLVVGSDDRSDMSMDDRLRLHLGTADFGRNTDTMLLVHVGDDGSVDAVSLPRDSLVRIPAHLDDEGKRHEPSDGKLNSAYGSGGAPLLVETVENATRLRIDHYSEVSFGGFLRIVDAVGGVGVCLPESVNDENSGLQLPAGPSTLDSAQSLAFVRARAFDPTADVGRMGRQQHFAAAAVNKVLSPATLVNPTRFNAIVDAVLSSITTDPELTPDRVRLLVDRLRRTDPSRVTFRTLPIGEPENVSGVGSVVRWRAADSTALFDAMRNPGAIGPAIDAQEASLPHVSRAPSEVRVRVLNGTDTPGRATSAAAALTAAGFDVTGTAGAGNVTRTRIEYDPQYDVSLATVQAALPWAEVVAVKGQGSTFKVTVGSDFTEPARFVVDGPSATATQQAEPTVATADPCAR